MASFRKRSVLIGGVLGLIGVVLVVGAFHPFRKVSASPTTISPLVEVVKVEQKDVPIFGEWIGTLDGIENADVRAQVTGYLQKQEYQEGAFVRKGQLLFQIDPRPFQAALDQAEGQLEQSKAMLANAQAVQGRTQLDVERYKPLAQEQAASQQDTMIASPAIGPTLRSMQESFAASSNRQIPPRWKKLAQPIYCAMSATDARRKWFASSSAPVPRICRLTKTTTP